MPFSFEALLYYLIFIDALLAVVIAWSGRAEKFNTTFSIFSRAFPLTRGWTLYYLILVLWIGYALSRLQII